MPHVSIKPYPVSPFPDTEPTMTKYTSISAYWRNDQDGGFALTVSKSGGYVDDVAMMIVAAGQYYREAGIDPEELLADLHLYASLLREADDVTEHDRCCILAIVAYLQDLGVITADEYNGMIYAQEMPTRH